MRLYKFVLSSIIVGVYLSSCNEDTFLTYDSESQIYFNYTPKVSNNLRDSIDYSFTYEKASVKDTIIQIDMSIMGDTAAIDRPFAFSLEAGSTAQEGVHYDIHSAIIPAGQAKGYLEVRVYRTEDLEKKKVSLIFNLERNEYFSTDYRRFAFEDSVYNPTKFKLHISDIIVAPAMWGANYYYYFGDFSVKKIRLLADLMNVELAKFEKLELSEMMAYGTTLKRYLELQKAQGTPVLEEDGTEMKAGSSMY